VPSRIPIATIDGGSVPITPSYGGTPSYNPPTGS
jgi:hypothetical protein